MPTSDGPSGPSGQAAKKKAEAKKVIDTLVIIGLLILALGVTVAVSVGVTILVVKIRARQQSHNNSMAISSVFPSAASSAARVETRNPYDAALESGGNADFDAGISDRRSSGPFAAMGDDDEL